MLKNYSFKYNIISYCIIFFLLYPLSCMSEIRSDDDLMINDRTLYLPNDKFDKVDLKNYETNIIFLYNSISDENKDYIAFKDYFITFLNKLGKKHIGTYYKLPENQKSFQTFLSKTKCSIPSKISKEIIILIEKGQKCNFLKINNYSSLISKLRDIELHLDNGKSKVYLKFFIDEFLMAWENNTEKEELIKFFHYLNSYILI